MIDRCGRNIDYLRISVTDRYNLRCIYCMPEEGVQHVERSLILQEEEILRICRVMAELGIRKIKLTGRGAAGAAADAPAGGKTEKHAGDRESDSDYKWCAFEGSDAGFCPGGTGRVEH